MLRLTLGHSRDCDGVTRRQFLQVGGLATFGLLLPEYLRAQAQLPAHQRKQVNCILLWMQGGPSHLDTFDPKPDAPAEIRGEFGVVDTVLPGVKLSEHLPRLARRLDKFSIVRGHDPQNGSHGHADHLMMSGHKFNPSLPFPCYGSVVSKERGYRNGMFPFVQLGSHVDRRFNGGTAGFLGDQYNPFEVTGDPSRSDFRVRDLDLVSGVDAARVERRHGMLAELERYQAAVEKHVAAPVQTRDAFYERAFSLVTSRAAKQAFDLTREPPRVRDAYGMNSFGQSCLLARRLIEAGVHFVTVTDGGWDTHQNNFRSLKDRLLPRLDRGYSALLDDLHERGLLDTTLVVWMGDFGRTPKVNASAGRDHWATAGVVCMGGGGVKTGCIVGATNALGEYVVDTPVRPQDIAATIYYCLGVPLDRWYRAHDGRPIQLIPEGKPVRELLKTVA
ncbi:MAG: DUF1501 domain-containing protein [Gemmataceae bacterium]